MTSPMTESALERAITATTEHMTAAESLQQKLDNYFGKKEKIEDKKEAKKIETNPINPTLPVEPTELLVQSPAAHSRSTSLVSNGSIHPLEKFTSASEELFECSASSSSASIGSAEPCASSAAAVNEEPVESSKQSSKAAASAHESSHSNEIAELRKEVKDLHNNFNSLRDDFSVVRDDMKASIDNLHLAITELWKDKKPADATPPFEPDTRHVYRLYHYPKLDYACNQCPASFYTWDMLQKHFVLGHGKPQVGPYTRPGERPAQTATVAPAANTARASPIAASPKAQKKLIAVLPRAPTKATPEQPSAQTKQTPASGPKGTEKVANLHCTVCKERFPTYTQLHLHLETSGHRVPPKQSKGGKGGRGGRGPRKAEGAARTMAEGEARPKARVVKGEEDLIAL